MLKICGIIGISSVEFFNFCGIERVEKIKTNIDHSKPSKLVNQSLFKQFQQKANIFFDSSLKI